MIITRKIQIIISQDQTKESAKEYRKQLYKWRDLIRSAANMIVTHKFVQQNVRDFAYIQPEIIDKFVTDNPDRVNKKGKPQFNIKNILNNEPGNSEQNTTYRVASSMLKGKCPAEFFSCLNQSVANNYKERFVEFIKGNTSIPSYRNIPIPFPGKVLNEIKVTQKDYKDKEGKIKTREVFSLDFYHIPIELFFGKDRSGNRLMIKRALEGTYKFCGSSIMIDDQKKKMFLLVSLDIPQKKEKVDENKTLHAVLGFETPIICSTNPEINEKGEEAEKFHKIGDKEEYLHRRLQIQDALKRLQAACKYNNGGHGRKKKTQAIERFHEKEKNYIDNKMHLYSKLLIDQAVKKGCGTINLANLKTTDKQVEESDEQTKKFLIRNWGYHGLVSKIEYKAKMKGIRVITQKEKEPKETETI